MVATRNRDGAASWIPVAVGAKGSFARAEAAGRSRSSLRGISWLPVMLHAMVGKHPRFEPRFEPPSG